MASHHHTGGVSRTGRDYENAGGMSLMEVHKDGFIPCIELLGSSRQHTETVKYLLSMKALM
jgi:hypothetical protein